MCWVFAFFSIMALFFASSKRYLWMIVQVMKMQTTSTLIQQWLHAQYEQDAQNSGSWIEAILSSINTIPLMDLILFSVMLRRCELRKAVISKKSEGDTATDRKTTLYHALKYYQPQITTRGMLTELKPWSTIVSHECKENSIQKNKDHVYKNTLPSYYF